MPKRTKIVMGFGKESPFAAAFGLWLLLMNDDDDDDEKLIWEQSLCGDRI